MQGSSFGISDLLMKFLMRRRLPVLPIAVLAAFAHCLFSAEDSPAEAPPAGDARALVQRAFDYMRGNASIGVFTMTIHRPEWERSQTLKAWTEGEKNSVFVITDPPQDRGNGTLKQGNQMWTFNPKINRVIKLPPSMMSQAWMGSDFTNNDLAKSDSILSDYTHEFVGTEREGGHAAHRIRSTPREGAPVVWGYKELLIRDDNIFLEEAYFDQDGRLVKTLQARQIELIGERLLPRINIMIQADDPERFTRIVYDELEFLEELPPNTITQAFLRNPDY